MSQKREQKEIGEQLQKSKGQHRKQEFELQKVKRSKKHIPTTQKNKEQKKKITATSITIIQ